MPSDLGGRTAAGVRRRVCRPPAGRP